MVGIFQIQLHLGKSLKLFLQRFIYVIPVSPVFLQKCLKFLLIFHHQIGKSLGGQGVDHGVHIPGSGMQGNFQPSHGSILLYQKQIASVILTQNPGKDN